MLTGDLPRAHAGHALTGGLYVLYVYAADHGTGAGRALLEAVLGAAEPAALRVADPSPRAQAFYRKHGFAADGTARSEDGVRDIRMVRGVQHGGTGRSRRPARRHSAGICRLRTG